MMTQFICRRLTKHHNTNIFYASKNWYVRLLFLLKFEVLKEVGVCVCVFYVANFIIICIINVYFILR
jgi:hypothetical protein